MGFKIFSGDWELNKPRSLFYQHVSHESGFGARQFRFQFLKNKTKQKTMVWQALGET